MKASLLILVSLVPLLPAVRRDARCPGHLVVQEQKASGACPTLTVSCADNLMLGVPAVFTANVSGGDEGVIPSFSWKVSAGTITSNQGSSVVVDTAELPRVGRQPLTATVEVGGYAPSCPNKFSCTTEVYVIIDIFPVDGYGNIRFSDEKARLDNFAIELRNSDGMSGYIACYGGRKGVRGEAARRCQRAKSYLVARRQIAPDRLVTVEGGYMEDLTVVLWILSRGAQFTPNPTVDPTEVEFVTKPKKRRARAPRRP